MLNDITIQRRAELRRVRTLLLASLISAVVFGVVMFVGGLWGHNIPVALVATVVIPVVRLVRSRLTAVARVLRMMGA